MKDPVVIIGTREYQGLKRLVKLWWAGWVVAIAAAGFGAWTYGRAQVFDRALAQVDRVHAEQVRDREAFARAWETQQKTTDSVLEMGAIFKKHQDEVEYNQTAVTDLVGKNKPWVKK
jgi:hypothetical protein